MRDHTARANSSTLKYRSHSNRDYFEPPRLVSAGGDLEALRGGLYTTAEDFLVFMSALAGCHRGSSVLLPPEKLREVTQINMLPLATNHIVRSTGFYGYYGLNALGCKLNLQPYTRYNGEVD